jgi:hypothetical protein
MHIRINTATLELNLDDALVFYILTGNGIELNCSYNPINFLKISSECSEDYVSRTIVALLLFLLAGSDYVGKK